MTRVLSVEEAREIYKGAEIREGAIIFKGAVIGKGARIRERAEICKGAVIGKGAIICEGAVIGKYAVIRQGAVIGEGAEIGKGAVIGAGALIGEERKNVKENYVIHGIGDSKTVTLFKCEDGWIVTCGCFNAYKGDTLEAFKKAVQRKYEDKKHPYYATINYLEALIESHEGE